MAAKPPPAMTPEILAKSQAARAANTAARKASPLRQDFADHTTWEELARDRGIRLPLWGTPPTASAISRWLRRMGKSAAWYYQVTGYNSREQFRERNPASPATDPLGRGSAPSRGGWPMRALAGTLLEADR